MSYLSSNMRQRAGGLLATAGSLAAALSGEPTTLLALGCALASDAVLTLRGDSRGFAQAAAFLCLADLSLALTPSIIGNDVLQASLIASGITWSLGIFDRRSPVVRPLVCTTNMVLKVPALIAAIHGGAPLMTAAIALWLASDVVLSLRQPGPHRPQVSPSPATVHGPAA